MEICNDVNSVVSSSNTSTSEVPTDNNQALTDAINNALIQGVIDQIQQDQKEASESAKEWQEIIEGVDQ